MAWETAHPGALSVRGWEITHRDRGPAWTRRLATAFPRERDRRIVESYIHAAERSEPLSDARVGRMRGVSREVARRVRRRGVELGLIACSPGRARRVGEQRDGRWVRAAQRIVLGPALAHLRRAVSRRERHRLAAQRHRWAIRRAEARARGEVLGRSSTWRSATLSAPALRREYIAAWGAEAVVLLGDFLTDSDLPRARAAPA